MKNFIFITVLVILASFAFTNTGCDKNTDCKATIIVRDSIGRLVSNANVKLFANVKNSAGVTYVGDVKASGVTDDGGVVKFTFKLPAIFDINAIKVVDSRTLTGTGIIKLEEGKNIDKEVSIR